MFRAVSRTNVNLGGSIAASSGIPIANGIKFVLPPAADQHGHGAAGGRSDAPPAWATGGRRGVSGSRVNGELKKGQEGKGRFARREKGIVGGDRSTRAQSGRESYAA